MKKLLAACFIGVVLMVSACAPTRTVYHQLDIDDAPIQEVIKPDMVIQITKMDGSTTLMRVAGYEGDDFLIGYELIDHEDFDEDFDELKVKIAINDIKGVIREESWIVTNHAQMTTGEDFIYDFSIEILLLTILIGLLLL